MHLILHLFTLVCLLGPLLVGGQSVTDSAPRQVIVQLAAKVDGETWAGRQPGVVAWKLLSAPLNTYLLQLDTMEAPLPLTKKLRSRPDLVGTVIHAQPNYRLNLRRSPDDPRYSQQWQLRNTGQNGRPIGNDHNLEAAWEVTTGGVTVNGDTIVIASIDNGIDLDHEDLAENIWINRDEIPGNGIDDDRNGYIDDVRGWNTSLETNDVEGGKGDHGTPVMGQIAARGNNGKGVTGVNWQAKVMNVTNDFDPLESEVIQAYSYVLEARKRYDATGGKEGAYVVATNASWGRDRAFPSQSPIWCAMYDSLGKYGILNVAAVPNTNVNVDEVGDLPSLCPSDYLIAVTSVTDRNQLVTNAARGNISVDMAAYGDGIYTTQLGNGYGPVFGTSFAAPAVTGAVGLLFSAPCTSFGELLLSDPAAAALYVKEVIYGKLRPLSALAETTVRGGILDVGAAVNGLMTDCNGCQAPTSFTVVAGSERGSLTASWNTVASVKTVSLRYRKSDTDNWTQLPDVTSPFKLTDLPDCATYELQLTAYCASGNAATKIITAETFGCCRQPDRFITTALRGGRIRAEWEPIPTALSYTLRYRESGENWIEITTTEFVLEVEELRNCRDYQFELRTNCNGDTLSFAQRRNQKTLGCGVCLDATYCQPAGFDNTQEWIAGVAIPGILNNNSGAEANHYANFGDLTEQAMVPGGVYYVWLTPGYRGSGFTEDFHVYVDWNQDAVFAESELMVQQSAPGGSTAEASFTVPPDAATGLTRMRVIMQFTAVAGNGCPVVTDRPRGGEVEDYCLDVGIVRGCPPPDSVAAAYNEATNNTLLSWGASAAPGGSYRLRYRERTESSFQEVSVEALTARIENVNLCSSYEVQIASVCAGQVGDFRTVFLGDDCVSDRLTKPEKSSWGIAPNPATDRTTVSWAATVEPVRIETYGMDGRLLLQQSVQNGITALTLRTETLSPGVYAIRLVGAGGVLGIRRLVVQ